MHGFLNHELHNMQMARGASRSIKILKSVSRGELVSFFIPFKLNNKSTRGGLFMIDENLCVVFSTVLCTKYF